jgi:hypothetical protein
MSELTQQSGSLTHLASDLGQAHQEYVCMSLAPMNEESMWFNEEKNHTGKKIISQLSACDVTRLVSLDTNNQA